MGTKSKWVNRRLTFYNAPLNFSTGSYAVDQNVVTTTAAGALNGYGLSYITTTAAGTYTLGAPEAGVEKQIIVNSSFAATVRASSVANSRTIASPSSDTQNSIILTPGSTYTASATLRGLSTVLWALMSGGVTGTTLFNGTVTLSSACT